MDSKIVTATDITDLNAKDIFTNAFGMHVVSYSLLPRSKFRFDDNERVDQSIMLLSGVARITLAGVSTEVSAPVVVIIPWGKKHEIVNISKSEQLRFISIFSHVLPFVPKPIPPQRKIVWIKEEPNMNVIHPLHSFLSKLETDSADLIVIRKMNAHKLDEDFYASVFPDLLIDVQQSFSIFEHEFLFYDKNQTPFTISLCDLLRNDSVRMIVWKTRDRYTHVPHNWEVCHKYPALEKANIPFVCMGVNARLLESAKAELGMCLLSAIARLLVPQ